MRNGLFPPTGWCPLRARRINRPLAAVGRAGTPVAVWQAQRV